MLTLPGLPASYVIRRVIRVENSRKLSNEKRWGISWFRRSSGKTPEVEN